MTPLGRASSLGWIPWLVVALGGALIIGALSIQLDHALYDSSTLTGYSLLAMMFLLAAFKVRKRLAASPLLNARTWLRIHIAFGLAAIVLFAFHTRALWPAGVYEQALASVFYIVSLSGIIGFLLERILPKRLAQIPEEFIYERSASELADMRAAVEHQVLLATRETKANTLGRHYIETLSWYFERPRFLFSHLWGSRRAEAWLNNQINGIERYLDDDERVHLASIRDIGRRKTDLDAQYAIQRTLKLWLFLHVPLVATLLIISLWHLLLVNVYTL